MMGRGGMSMPASIVLLAADGQVEVRTDAFASSAAVGDALASASMDSLDSVPVPVASVHVLQMIEALSVANLDHGNAFASGGSPADRPPWELDFFAAVSPADTVAMANCADFLGMLVVADRCLMAVAHFIRSNPPDAVRSALSSTGSSASGWAVAGKKDAGGDAWAIHGKDSGSQWAVAGKDDIGSP